MSYNPAILQALRVWYQNHLVADENSTLMCQDHASAEHCERISNLCSTRMEELHKAEDAVDSFKGAIDVPPLLQAFWNAEADEGCASCHLSASGPKHEECRVKMERYWKSKGALIKWLEQDVAEHSNAADIAKLREDNQDLRNLVHYLPQSLAKLL